MLTGPPPKFHGTRDNLGRLRRRLWRRLAYGQVGGFGVFVTVGVGTFGTVLAGQAGFSKAIPFLLGGAVFAGIGYAHGGGEL